MGKNFRSSSEFRRKIFDVCRTCIYVFIFSSFNICVEAARLETDVALVEGKDGDDRGVVDMVKSTTVVGCSHVVMVSRAIRSFYTQHRNRSIILAIW